MGSTWISIFLLNHVCFLLINCGHAVILNRRAYPSSSVPPTLVPDCSALEPPPCNNTYSTDPVTGEYTWDYYLETCPSHQCATTSPVNFPLVTAKVTANKTIPQDSKRVLRKFPGQERENSPFTGLEVPQYTMDKENKFIRTGSHWFCSSKMISYTARVAKNTGLAPGEREDQWAQCQWERANSLVGLGIDCMLERYGCYFCTSSYQVYLCAIAFPKCQPAVGGLPPTGTADIYGPDTLSLVDQQNIMYTITKPCRTICYQILRMCDAQIQISCHRKESRDWADYPDCNVGGDINHGKLNV